MTEDVALLKVPGHILFSDEKKVVYKLDNGDVKSFKAATKAEKNMPPHDLIFE